MCKKSSETLKCWEWWQWAKYHLPPLIPYRQLMLAQNTIHQKSRWKNRKKIYWYLLKLSKRIKLPLGYYYWVSNTNPQHFAYLFLNCWDYSCWYFRINKYSPYKCQTPVVDMVSHMGQIWGHYLILKNSVQVKVGFYSHFNCLFWFFKSF